MLKVLFGTSKCILACAMSFCFRYSEFYRYLDLALSRQFCSNNSIPCEVTMYCKDLACRNHLRD
jgi:hypothetical protein